MASSIIKNLYGNRIKLHEAEALTTNNNGSVVISSSGRRMILAVKLNSMQTGENYTYTLGQVTNDTAELTYIHLMDEAGNAQPNKYIIVSYLYISF